MVVALVAVLVLGLVAVATRGARRGAIGLFTDAAILGPFGNALDGDKTVAGTETLTADMFYDDLTVPAGTILQTDGYRVFVRGNLTVAGTIRNNGNPGSGATAGANTSSNVLGQGRAGGNGGSTNGTNATASEAASSFGGNGGNGGAAGANTGGTGSTVGTLDQLHRHRVYAIGGIPETNVDGGRGGGGGAGDVTNSGGGGGGGGGVICLRANRLVLTAGHSIEAKGGAGAAGLAGNTGGGGGGGGGLIVLHYNEKSGVALVTDVTGGAGGAGPGTGDDGAAGTAGRVVEVANR